MLTTSLACVYRVIEVRRSRNVYKEEIIFLPQSHAPILQCMDCTLH